ncbi:LysM domain-containing protein [Ferrimonas sp. YFM]|uniref:LysM peptidoglycan-binding domain-containing protein n=1 Tax=Ferrimonas sp. YFM TaxID=3028878 RepID=UPI002574774B|nr:LysM domain-containing protein [Ferrimonas sp. YFM]BDY02983.1 peptidoglycan-binding protein LysM [Ferrimonas sp. YFM]
MRRTFLMLFLILAIPGWADGLSLRPGAPKIYTVKQGDTLWDISGLYLDDPWLWPRLWQVNPAIANPHLIYPGDRLLLTLVNGVPVLRRQRGRDSSLPLPTLDRALIGPLLDHVAVLSPEALKQAPVVESGSRNSLRFVAGDTLYLSEALPAGGEFGVFHHRQSLIDPDNDALLGEEMVLVATGVADGAGHLKLIHSLREASVGEPLYALSQIKAQPLVFPLEPAEPGTELPLLAAPNQASEVGPGELVYLRRSEQLKPGKLLTVVHSPRAEARLTRGELMVVRCYERVCLALVTRAGHPLQMADRAVTPEGRWRLL